MKHNVNILLMLCALGISAGPKAESAVTEGDTLLLEEAVSEGDLSGQRGEGTVIDIDDITLNQTNLDGENFGNSVTNSVTGGNFISGSAFNGANGMFDTIQNSGNNVLIQKATIVNISLE